MSVPIVVVQGKSSRAQRKEAEEAFQQGKAKVFLGSMEAAGEAITLTRASAVLFVELAWVPATMLQAEDRGHRIGQSASTYLIETLVARLDVPAFNLDQAMSKSLSSKIEHINLALQESATILGDIAPAYTSVLEEMASALLAWGAMEEP